MGAPRRGVERRPVLRRRAKRSPTAAGARCSPRLQTVLSVLRNYRPSRAPEGFGSSISSRSSTSRAAERWAVSGRPPTATASRTSGSSSSSPGCGSRICWTYDFRRTEMCIIPYATQMGEISFCAYNTGVGWRHIVEKMHQNATVAEWYKEHGQARGVREPAQGRAARAACAAHRAHDSQRRPARPGRGQEGAAAIRITVDVSEVVCGTPGACRRLFFACSQSSWDGSSVSRPLLFTSMISSLPDSARVVETF